uniref:hypothetical protein n=1 Tax=Lactobacillus acidophilus TaxID=1579 RepID=UPI003F57C24B
MVRKPLTDAERKKRHNEAQRAYYKRLKQRAEHDATASEQLEKNKYSRHFTVVKKFVKDEINKDDIKKVNEWLKERLNQLNKKEEI